MIKIEHLRDRDIIVLRASGTLTAQDYDAAVPELENALELAEGKLRLLIRLEDFKGWEIGALWRDLKFDLKHLNDFGRIAVTGETTLEEWGTALSAPFTKAEIRFFPNDQKSDAQEWLEIEEQTDG